MRTYSGASTRTAPAWLTLLLLSGATLNAQQQMPGTADIDMVDFQAEFVLRTGDPPGPVAANPLAPDAPVLNVLPPPTPPAPLANAWVEEIFAARSAKRLGVRPAGFVEVYEITAYWRNSTGPGLLKGYLTDLSTSISLLTGGNEYYEDPVLSWGCPGGVQGKLNAVGPQECFKVVFRISLKALAAFRFFVNIHGSAYPEVAVAFDEDVPCFGFDRKTFPRSLMVPQGGSWHVNALTTPVLWATRGYIQFVPLGARAKVRPATATTGNDVLWVDGLTTGSETVNARSTYFSLPAPPPGNVGRLNVDVKPERRYKLAIHRVTDPVAGAPPEAAIPTVGALFNYLRDVWRYQANIRFDASDIVRSDMAFTFDVNGNGRFDGDGADATAEWNRIDTIPTAEGSTYIHIFYVSTVKDDTAWTNPTTRRIVLPAVGSSLTLKTTAHEIGHALQIPWDTLDPVELMYRARRNLSDACVVRKLDWDKVNPTP